MKIIIISLFFLIYSSRIVNAQDSIELAKKQQKFLSNKAVKTNVMGVSTFNSFASYLYATDIATIHTDNPEVLNTKLKPLPDPDLRISLRELFDEIAKQTSSKWTFDGKSGYWLFTKPLPYEIELVPGWRKEIRPGYVFYKPPSAPAGMDIYMADRVESSETSISAQNRIAEQFANPITPGITASLMEQVSLPHHKALYYTTEISQRGIIWRQWVIIDKERSFVIVSAIKLADETTVFPEVEKMVKSFKVLDPAN